MLYNRQKMENIIEATDNDFEEKVIKGSASVPVLVDFWAPWCAPCLMLSPTLENLTTEYNGKFILAKVNVDESPTLSRKYSIMSIPAVKIFKEGVELDGFVGAYPENVVREMLDKILKG